MRKFGGWTRIFIVLSVIWIVIGGSFGWNHAYDGGRCGVQTMRHSHEIGRRSAGLP
jgi:hypothetical protein